MALSELIKELDKQTDPAPDPIVEPIVEPADPTPPVDPIVDPVEPTLDPQDPAPVDPEPAPDAEATFSFNELEKITGRSIDGDHDLSYEGIADYIQKTNQAVVQEYVAKLQESLPEVYNLMEIAENGGDYVDAMRKFASFDKKDLASIELQEDDVDSQRDIMRQVLKDKGLTTSMIKTIIESAEDSNTLYKDTSHYLSEIKDQKAKHEANSLREANERAAVEKERIAQEWQAITGTIDTNKLGNFIIPETEKKVFKDYLQQNLMKDAEGKLFIPNYVSEENALAAEFFRYRKGNLDSIVTQKAATQNVLKLQKKAINPKHDPSPMGLREYINTLQ